MVPTLRTIFCLLLILQLSCQQENQPNQTKKQSDRGAINLYEPPNVPNYITFANEPLPMERTDVKEAFDFELIKNSYWHSNTILILKRKAKYFPIIEKLLSEANIPDDFKYLAVAESNLNPTIESPAKAKGLWQFLPETAKDYNLEVNNYVDERMNVEKSTRAAAKYLKELKNFTGSWSLAAAAYNTGLGNVKKAMAEQNYNNETDTYYNLKLHRETERYLFRILAFKTILESPKKYGFSIAKKDGYSFPKFDTIHITKTIENLSIWAKKHGENYKTLVQHNPWILTYSLPVTPPKSYHILIPINE